MHFFNIKSSLFIIGLFLISPIIGNAQIAFNSETGKKLDALFDEYNNEAGAAIGIMVDGKVLYQKGFGYANLEYKIPVTPQTVFETGGVAMHITATAILLLEKEGKLSLDDPIQKYLTEFPNYKKGEVTIRHCFHHSSGLRDYLNLLIMSGQDFHIPFDNKDAFNLLQKQKELTIQPGSDYRYSHSNYLTLALIVERISGMSIGEFAQQQIFKPIGMNHTFFYEDSEMVIPNRALLYGKEGEEFKLKQNYKFTACGDGRLYSTIEDMMKWSANFGDSKIGDSPNFMNKLFTKGKLNNGDTMSYALGLEDGNYLGHPLIGHNGWWKGATAMFFHCPDDDFFVMTMGNNIEKGAIGKAFQAAKILLPTKATTTTQPSTTNASIVATPSIKITKKEKEQICGSYFSYSIGYERKVYLKEGELFFSDGEHTDSKLSPFEKNGFRIVGDVNNSMLRFENTGKERVMKLYYGQRPPMKLVAFTPANYSAQELMKFTGKYFSEELGGTYDLSMDDKTLKISLEGKPLAEYSPLMENLFNSPHDGYVKFETGKDGKIQKFTINDYSLGNLSFFKK